MDQTVSLINILKIVLLTNGSLSVKALLTETQVYMLKSFYTLMSKVNLTTVNGMTVVDCKKRIEKRNSA